MRIDHLERRGESCLDLRGHLVGEGFELARFDRVEHRAYEVHYSPTNYPHILTHNLFQSHHKTGETDTHTRPATPHTPGAGPTPDGATANPDTTAAGGRTEHRPRKVPDPAAIHPRTERTSADLTEHGTTDTFG